MSTNRALSVVPLSKADIGRVLDVDNAAFFGDPDEAPQEPFLDHFEWDRAFGVVEEGSDALAGVYASYDMQVTVPGPGGGLRRLPMAALSWVSVHPDYRRRGLLRQMMRHHMDWVHENGTALGGLHASEVGVYGRFGYGTASLDAVLKMARGTSFVAPALDERAKAVRTRFTRLDEKVAADVHVLHQRFAERELGTVTRTDAMSTLWMRDTPALRRGREPRQVMFAEAHGERTGYAIFSRKGAWERGKPNGSVQVREMVAADPASLLALARRMVDFDLTASVEFANRRLDDPLIWWAGGPRTMTVELADALWLRLVDVPEALVARGYSAPCDVVLEVTDDLCPWNARRWRLVVDAVGTATCAPTDDPAVLTLPVGSLGAAYLGSRSLVSQADAGLISSSDQSTLYAVSRAFRAEREPVAALMF